MDLKPIFPAKEGINQTNYYWFENGFTTQEIDTIVNGSLEYEFQKAIIMDEGLFLYFCFSCFCLFIFCFKLAFKSGLGFCIHSLVKLSGAVLASG